LPERAQNREPYFVRGHLGATARPHLVLHLLGEYGQLVFGDRPSLAGAAHSLDDLVAGERLSGTAPFGHHQDHCLLSGESPPARRAGPPAADRGTVVGGPAIDDPAVRVPAVRAEHSSPSVPGGSRRLFP